MQSLIEYSNEVKLALENKKPILALESTIITHGMPYPQNLETAIMVEDIVREQNVTPATIAILNGKIKIGLSAEELKQIANDKSVVKASRRDISYLLSQKKSAGTTVAATLYCANLAGIKVFATGGIGGVHRGDAQDISADLIELARTPIAVVCAGAKAILDLPKTLEFLETHSIPVFGYQTDSLPAFYTAKTNYPVTSKLNSIAELTNTLKINWKLGLTSGVLIANPIPIQDEIASDIIEPIISAALKVAEKNNITGKEVTPFLLGQLAKVTEGKSLQANIQLIKNNAKIGAQLAYALMQ